MTRDKLKEKYGCKIMIIQGASGDIRPRFQQDNADYLEVNSYVAAERGFSRDYRRKYDRQSRIALDMTGESVSESLGTVLEGITPRPISRAVMKSIFCRFVADVPSIKRASEIAEEAKREAGLDGSRWLDEVGKLIERGVKRQHADVEVQFCLIGDGGLCGVPNEAMCKIALDVQSAVRSQLFFFNGYTNGCNSYLPTAEEYDRGGYEVLWSNLIYFPYHGRVMPLNRETAEILVEEAAANWASLLERPEKP